MLQIKYQSLLFEFTFISHYFLFPFIILTNSPIN